MTVEELESLYEDYEGRKWNSPRTTVNTHHKRDDLNAMLILSELEDGDGDFLGGADHDIIYLSDIDDVVEKLTPDIATQLFECSVMVDDGYLTMFV